MSLFLRNWIVGVVLAGLLTSGLRVPAGVEGCAEGGCEENCCCQVDAEATSCCSSGGAPAPTVRLVAACPCGGDHGPLAGHVFQLPPFWLPALARQRAPLVPSRASHLSHRIPVENVESPEAPPPRTRSLR